MTAGALLVSAVVVAIAATVQLSAGFGFALAAGPLLSLVIDPHEAVVVSLMLATLTNGWQAWHGRADRDGPIVRRLVGGAAFGLPLGFAIYLALDERWLQLAIGVAVLAAVALIARGIDLRHVSGRLDVGVGVVTGALTTSVAVNGPPMVFVLQARHFTPTRFRATITTVFAVLDVVSVALFAVAGRIDERILAVVAVSLPGLALGATAGTALRAHLDPVRFRRLVLVLLTVAAISALTAALTG